MAVKIPRPGEVYRVSLEGTGHVLRGPHYAVVVSDEPFNHLSTIVIVPLSTGAKHPLQYVLLDHFPAGRLTSLPLP